MIDELEMVGFLKTNGTACRFVGLTIDTPVVKMRKDSPFQGIRKIAKKTGIINANYNTSVRNRIAESLGVTLAEVEYDNGEVWYEHLKTFDGKNLPLVQHRDETKRNGKFYFQYFPHKSTHTYVMPSGEIIPDEILKPFLYKESARPDYKPAVIAVSLSNVRELKASGVIIQMPDFEEAEKILAQ